MSTLSRPKRERLELLHRRANYLANFLACHKGSPAQRHWVAAELAALEWVLEIAERALEVNGAHDDG